MGLPSISGEFAPDFRSLWLKINRGDELHAVIEVDFEFAAPEMLFEIIPAVLQLTAPFRLHDRTRVFLNRTVLPTGSCTRSWAEVAGKEYLKGLPKVGNGRIRVPDPFFEVVFKIF